MGHFIIGYGRGCGWGLRSCRTASSIQIGIKVCAILALDVLWMLAFHDAKAAREQVDVVKTFLEDDTALEDAMSLIIVIDHQNLVRLVFVH